MYYLSVYVSLSKISLLLMALAVFWAKADAKVRTFFELPKKNSDFFSQKPEFNYFSECGLFEYLFRVGFFYRCFASTAIRTRGETGRHFEYCLVAVT